MTAAAFNRHLTRRLCWIDGVVTHASSAKQRQCPRCRRKWSYEGLAKAWIVAQEYCAGRSRKEAAEAAAVDVHTAGRHYASFDLAMATYVRALLASEQSWMLGDAEKFNDVLSKAMRSPRTQRQKQRLAARVCLARLPVSRRLDLIFQEVFAKKVERFARSR